MARHPAKHTSKLDHLGQALREQGLPLTVQRRTIFAALEGRRDHPTADQIYEGVKDRLPGLSRTTVYRVLETLVRVGAARRVDHPGAATRFDPRVDHHHHLVCLRCDRVVDIELASEGRIPVPDARRTGFRILDYSIHFSGHCSVCLKNGRSVSGSPGT